MEYFNKVKPVSCYKKTAIYKIYTEFDTKN